MFDKILLVRASTPEGDAALDAATRLAAEHGAKLYLVRHVRVSAQDSADEPKPARDALDALTERLRGEGIVCEPRWTVGVRTVATAVLETAKEQDVDLIVVGVRRRSPVGKLVLGSNSQEVLLNADCPVLAVKAAAHEE